MIDTEPVKPPPWAHFCWVSFDNSHLRYWKAASLFVVYLLMLTPMPPRLTKCLSCLGSTANPMFLRCAQDLGSSVLGMNANQLIPMAALPLHTASFTSVNEKFPAPGGAVLKRSWPYFNALTPVSLLSTPLIWYVEGSHSSPPLFHSI